MLILISNSKLNFSFTFNQSHKDILDGLRKSFIEKESEEVFSRAAKIIVLENNFYHIIKDRYGPTLIGEHIDNLYDVIDSHLDI